MGFRARRLRRTCWNDLRPSKAHEIAAIVIDVPFELLEKRATGRRSCPVCGEIYNIYFKPPRREGYCDLHPEAILLQRADDTADKIKVRLETYNEQTKPLIDYYDKTGRLHRVDGTRTRKRFIARSENMLDEQLIAYLVHDHREVEKRNREDASRRSVGRLGLAASDDSG